VGLGHPGRHHGRGPCGILAIVGGTPNSGAAAWCTLVYRTTTSAGSLRIESTQRRQHMRAFIGVQFSLSPTKGFGKVGRLLNADSLALFGTALAPNSAPDSPVK
jgi:hypothetical protein